MPIYRCEKCGICENTATSDYWSRKYPSDDSGNTLPSQSALCSQCDPEIGKWHGFFKRMSAKGFFLCSDGFLVHKDELETEDFKRRVKEGLRVVREITEDGVL